MGSLLEEILLFVQLVSCKINNFVEIISEIE